jgi:mRNA interferase HigB
MQIIARKTLRDFWIRHPQAETPLVVWFSLVSKAHWTGPADIKKMFGSTVDFVADNRVIFDIAGNKYRTRNMSASIRRQCDGKYSSDQN